MQLAPKSSTVSDVLQSLASETTPALVPTLSKITLTQKELTRLKWEGSYWKAQHQRACEREEHLKQELAQREAQIRDLQQRLFGKKSEASSTSQQVKPKTLRPRGHQRGQRGHGRIPRPDLPVITEHLGLSGKACCCPICGLSYTDFPGAEESDLFEIEVTAYRRRISRKRYKKACSCQASGKLPEIIAAPPPPKIIPRSPFGITIWEHLLLGKFLHAQPLHRILRQMRDYGLPLAMGTMTGGLQRIAPLFEPLYQALAEHQRHETRFHNDESRWEVYTEIEGKVGHRWQLWVTRSDDVIYYQIAPTRSASVPIAHFAGLIADMAIVVCDRYSAYKKLARLNSAILLAFCWVHVRRDFLTLATGFPDMKEWALAWVEEIGLLYHLNHQRLIQWDETQPLVYQSPQFQQEQDRLEYQAAAMKNRCALLLQADQAARSQPYPPTAKNTKGMPTSLLRPGELHPAQRKVLTSLDHHWPGLTLFLVHPEVPMDNNRAEQAIRNPVVGRKNYYGSGSIWSANLAAMMFSLLQTVVLWHLNPAHWLREYLTACANNGAKAPSDLNPFLPWAMSGERKQLLAQPPPCARNTS
jgi:transposase